MNDQKFVGKKVRVKALGEFIGVWTFDSEREYEILYTRMDWLHIVDNRGLSSLQISRLCSSVWIRSL